MYKVVIIRDKFFGDEASLGTCLVYDDEDKQVFKSESLERGWRDNMNRVSCVPVGKYQLKLEYSSRFRTSLYELKDVPNRSECKFHAANYWHQLNGCIALGNNRKYIDGDAVEDITSSRNTMKEFHDAMANKYHAELYVFDVPSLIVKSI